MQSLRFQHLLSESDRLPGEGRRRVLDEIISMFAPCKRAFAGAVAPGMTSRHCPGEAVNGGAVHPVRAIVEAWGCRRRIFFRLRRDAGPADSSRVLFICRRPRGGPEYAFRERFRAATTLLVVMGLMP